MHLDSIFHVSEDVRGQGRAWQTSDPMIAHALVVGKSFAKRLLRRKLTSTPIFLANWTLIPLPQSFLQLPLAFPLKPTLLFAMNTM